MSSDFEDIKPDGETEYVWRKPSIDTVLACHEKPFYCNYYLAGGLERILVNRL